ncbi:hypothetical protein EKD04_017600 [Chloroflexales bacterium ZM16-3]|nr:hypothetical protein [Chloroflexales bacterium ZM16-3]
MSDLSQTKLSPVQRALALLIKDTHREDEAAGRAVNRLLGQTKLPPLVSFDGVEAIFQSASEPELRNVTTAEGCSCRGGNHAWCVHRVRFRILMAEAAILDPLSLLSAFVEHAPADMRRTRPYPWPSPVGKEDGHRVGGGVVEVDLPASLGSPVGRPKAQVTPLPADIQQEIDELYP